MNKNLEMNVAKILKASEAKSLEDCSLSLKSGYLVSFPTETVYGLGAHAFDEKALEQIFFAKGRPKSDPLIVHISELAQAESLTEMSAFQRQCFDALGKAFWPGPLTIIVKAAQKVPKIVTAGGDAIAIRIPAGKIALRLLKLANIPVAAPSANKFGHVSPTKAKHVFDDLGHVPDLTILENDQDCDIGIESTVIKITNENEIHLLRPGFISTLQISKVLEENNISCEIKKIRKVVREHDLLTKHLDAPGQLLTHYAPEIETFILISQNNLIHENIQKFSSSMLNKTVLIDFNKKNIVFSNKVLKYFDLSENGDTIEASKNLFNLLRESEVFPNAEYILLPDFSKENSEELLAIFDRIYRAASGKFVRIS